MSTFEQVRSIVAKSLDESEEMITPATSLTEDLAADSLARVETTIALEEAFGLEFDEDAFSLTTVEQIVDYIDVRLGEQP